jgi:hypothetical protein
VSLVVDRYDQDWRRLWYLLITGTAELLEAGDEHGGAIALLRDKYPQYQDMSPAMSIETNPVIKITPHRVVAWGDWR